MGIIRGAINSNQTLFAGIAVGYVGVQSFFVLALDKGEVVDL